MVSDMKYPQKWPEPAVLRGSVAGSMLINKFTFIFRVHTEKSEKNHRQDVRCIFELRPPRTGLAEMSTRMSCLEIWIGLRLKQAVMDRKNACPADAMRMFMQFSGPAGTMSESSFRMEAWSNLRPAQLNSVPEIESIRAE
jgi:hypothetical protein